MILKIIIWLAVILFLMFLQVKYVQLTGIFFPIKELEASPKDFGLEYQEVYLKTINNQQINGWFLPFKDASYTLLFLHGNGGNISHRLDKLIILRQCPVNIFIIDYQGYGKSSGSPSEEALYIDAKAAYDYLLNQLGLDKERIILYGESLGGAAAIDLASNNKIGGLVIEGTFSSAKDMGKHFYPYIPAFLMPDIFNSQTKIKSISQPKLFIHSIDDEIVPFKLAKKLYDSAPEPKKLIQTKGGHNNLFLDYRDEFVASLCGFFKTLPNP
ncbi:MAG: alpha/beta hydrolase [Candidatus Omnitrophica bacterium]|nr:alpha/beta hydrolase [Candidatus Omnitrophota bacterium]